MKLVREAYTDIGTFGQLTMPSGLVLYTCELPWRENQRSISCIPEGCYMMRKRESAVVQRTSGGEFMEGWEVRNVPDRTFIMVHVGNTIADAEGCILVGAGRGFVNGKWAVTNSRDAFRKFMAELDGQPEWMIEISSVKAGRL